MSNSQWYENQCALSASLNKTLSSLWWLHSATCQQHDPISHSVALSWHWANQSLHYHNNAEHVARKWQVSIFRSLVWLAQSSNLRGPNSPISQNRKRTLYSFGLVDSEWRRKFWYSKPHYSNLQQSDRFFWYVAVYWTQTSKELQIWQVDWEVQCIIRCC